ncbi:hypothetical protein [Melittangium boletus]|uniref:hypothetical protein n=1 Tax=Melittangium boletus TaxID=83453 RepID=UPI003DA30775
MNTDELVLAWVRLLFKVDAPRWEDALTRFENELGPGWSVRALAVPRTYSIGARLRDGRELPLSAWREALGLEAAVESRVVDLGAFSAEGLPEHMAAAFANTRGLGLAVRVRGVPSVYALETVNSRRHAITPAQWVELLRQQPHPDAVREALARELSASNALNHRAPVTAAGLEDYLRSEEGASVLDFLGNDLLAELQRTLRRLDAREHVPDALRPLFRMNDPDFLDRMMLGVERQQEFIPSSKALSLASRATGLDFVALVDAQPFARKIWERVAEHFNLNRFSEDADEFDAAGARDRLLRDPENFWNLSVEHLMRQWQGICQAHGAAPVIPEAQRALVRSTYEEARAQDKGFVPPEEQLLLQEEEEGYQVLRFQELEQVPPERLTPVPSPGAEREAFVIALREAQAFAQKEQSPFAEAFKLARFVLETDAWRLSDERLSDERVEVLRAAVVAAGFSDHASEILGRKLRLLTHFEQFHPAEDTLRGLLACALADVFGGMGSWNDQYFETPEAQATYEQVSARLHAALRAFTLANLNAE